MFFSPARLLKLTHCAKKKKKMLDEWFKNILHLDV